MRNAPPRLFHDQLPAAFKGLFQGWRNRVQLWRERATTLDSLQHVVADCLHLRMFEGSRKSAPLSLDRPFTDSFVDQKMNSA